MSEHKETKQTFNPKDGGKKICFTILNAEEFCENKDQFPFHRELQRSMGSIRYCKAEVYKEYILGTIRLPKKNEHRHALLTFGFCLTGDSVLFVEGEGQLKPWLEKQKDSLQEADLPDLVLLRILEYMIEEDMLYLSHFASQVDQMEESISSGREIADNFFLSLTKYRQKLSEFNCYYEQLAEIGEMFRVSDFGTTKKDVQDWERFTRRVERLQNHVCLLRESILQLRELCQSIQDAKQNKIMGILTIVTTFFLPLTLLTGWYGMNFAYMPELSWRYGYMMVIAIAIAIALAEFLYFKKKKFF